MALMDPQKDLSLPEILLKLHQDYPGRFAIFYGLIALFVLLVLVGIWQLWGGGPRRRRGLNAARTRLTAGDWKGALEQLKRTREIGSFAGSWARSFDQFEAECLKAAAESASKEKKFEDALEFGLRAAELIDGPEHEVRMNVQAAMLAEIRRLFSRTGETEPILDLVVRTLQVQSPCREASFWQAMCEIRKGAMDSALKHLQVSRTGQSANAGLDAGFAEAGAPGVAPAPPSTFIDPSLYLGAVLLRAGDAKDALRFLTEANRMDANCPFVTLQLGAAIVAAGGDTNMAVRALQRALGPKGLGQWQENPDRAWVEGMPEHRSYVRKLAEQYPFVCPVFGEDMKYLIRQGNLALAHGQFKLNNFQEASVLFDKVLKEGAPSLPILRGLGLSLAKLGRFDDAFVHLRTAHEMEFEKDRLTTGYLALCGACGKPARPEDKRQNIAWAVSLVTPFNAPGDVEWIGLINRIFAEARAHDIPLSRDDQLYLCEHLISIKACDPQSAQAFHHLMATEPAATHPEYAWLYCRADEQYDVNGPHALALYALTYRHPEPARAYYAEQGWNFDDVELMYLRRAAQADPGHWPAPLGADYAARGERLLLAKAQQYEDAGQRDAALQTIEVLVKLSPSNTSAMDRAAMLHYRAQRFAPALELLEQWHQTQPLEPLPLVRQAIVLHQQGSVAACFAKVRAAMALAQGRRRANISFLAARLALQSYFNPKNQEPIPEAPDLLAAAQGFLQDCLAHDADHPQALWCLAALRWLSGEKAALAEQAATMRDAGVADVRYLYFSALCHLLGDQFEQAIDAHERLTQWVAKNNPRPDQRAIAAEAGYLAALAQIRLDRRAAAIDGLRRVTYDPKSPTLSHAQALLGEVLFEERRHDEAILAWQALDAGKRTEWQLADPLAKSMFISALESLGRAEYEQASEKLRQAGRLGFRDRRLGPLLVLSLFKAGQQAIYASETAPVPFAALAPDSSNV